MLRSKVVCEAYFEEQQTEDPECNHSVCVPRGSQQRHEEQNTAGKRYLLTVGKSLDGRHTLEEKRMVEGTNRLSSLVEFLGIK